MKPFVESPTHFVFQPPQELKTVPVWLAAYGGHFDVFVVAFDEPTGYDAEDDKWPVEGHTWTLGADEFAAWFGGVIVLAYLKKMGILREDGRPTDTEIRTWVKSTMTLPEVEFPRIDFDTWV